LHTMTPQVEIRSGVVVTPPSPRHMEVMHDVMSELRSVTAPNRRHTKVVRNLSEKSAHWQLMAKEDFALEEPAPMQPVPLRSSEFNSVPPMASLHRSITAGPRMQVSQSERFSRHASTPTMRRIRSPGGTYQTFVKWNQEDVRGSVIDPSKSYFDDAVKQRANEQCMPLLLRNQQQRQTLRTGRRVGERRCARVQTIALAGKFESVYAETRNTMEGRLCFDPPSRSNSVTEAEVIKALGK